METLNAGKELHLKHVLDDLDNDLGENLLEHGDHKQYHNHKEQNFEYNLGRNSME